MMQIRSFWAGEEGLGECSRAPGGPADMAEVAQARKASTARAFSLGAVRQASCSSHGGSSSLICRAAMPGRQGANGAGMSMKPAAERRVRMLRRSGTGFSQMSKPVPVLAAAETTAS